ncbi:MAG: DedA family protein [Candidatus ainarchaeum sp.]|nr:DedA family protein [Candidatus ainarchaeum sp.]MDD3975944.1 DedA family protein [Candidatus ainarchaeum sp.]
MIEEILLFFDFFLSNINYFSIFFLMLIESSFIPFPSELIMIPAGYLAFKGNLNIFLVIFFGILGSIIGALINYFIGKFLGIHFILKKKKFLFINFKTLNKSEIFFRKYGNITTFIGRLIPAVRQYISVPAGIFKMNISKFILYTFFGSFIWNVFLVILGFFIGESISASIINIYNLVILIVLGIVILFVFIFYIFKNKR